MAKKRKRSAGKQLKLKKGFLDFPPEVRNMIYKLVFDEDGSQPAAYHLNILRTCRAVHEEAVALAYNMHSHIVHIRNHGQNDRTRHRWRAVWTMHSRQSSTIRQLDPRVAKLRPQIASIITSLHIHEVTKENPTDPDTVLIKRLIPDVSNIASQLDSFNHLRQFSWAIHSRHRDFPFDIPRYPQSMYVDYVSIACTAGVLSKIVQAVPKILSKWPLLEEINIHLPDCSIDVPSVMSALRKHIPDNPRRRTRQACSEDVLRVTGANKVLADDSQLRIRTNRKVENSDVWLSINQDAVGENQCIRKRT